MTLADLDRFDPKAIRAFQRIFGVALIVEVLTSLREGVWGVHTGALYPWHHLPFFPLYPAWALAIEWAVTVTAGVLFVMGHRHAAKLAAFALFAGLTQRYSNHAALLFLVAFFSSIDPKPAEVSPALGLVRAQILIVYLFGALNKVTHGFLSGASLGNLLGLPRSASIAVVIAEIALPVLLVVRPRIALVGVVLMHLSFSFFMPGLLSFGLCMIAMAVLWLRPTT